MNEVTLDGTDWLAKVAPGDAFVMSIFRDSLRLDAGYPFQSFDRRRNILTVVGSSGAKRNIAIEELTDSTVAATFGEDVLANHPDGLRVKLNRLLIPPGIASPKRVCLTIQWTMAPWTPFRICVEQSRLTTERLNDGESSEVVNDSLSHRILDIAAVVHYDDLESDGAMTADTLFQLEVSGDSSHTINGSVLEYPELRLLIIELVGIARGMMNVDKR